MIGREHRGPRIIQQPPRSWCDGGGFTAGASSSIRVESNWGAILIGFNALLWSFLPFYLRNGFITIAGVHPESGSARPHGRLTPDWFF